MDLELFLWELTSFTVVRRYKLSPKEETIRNIVCIEDHILIEYETIINVINIQSDNIQEKEIVVDVKRETECFSFFLKIDNGIHFIRLDETINIVVHKLLEII